MKHIRKHLLLLLTLLVGGVASSWAADEVTADFNSGLPEGWSLVGNITNDDTRAKSGKGIWTSERSTTDNYVVTEPIEGSVTLYWRSYGTSSSYPNGQFIVYAYDDALGETIYTSATYKSNTWKKETFSLGTYTGRIAIALYSAAIDDVTYTPYVVSETASLQVTDFATGSSYDFGGTPVPEGTTKTFTLKNKGLADLAISSIAVTGGYTITEGTDITTIAAESSADVTVATPAADATGKLTITSNDANSPYVINLTSTYKVPAPIMGLDMTSINFGKVTANASQSITVSNTGDAALTANITSDNTDFTVSPATLNVAAGATGTFTITYNYDATAYGTHSATITVTPNAGDAKTIAVSAKVQAPNTWSEDFSGNALPSGWAAETNWTFSDGVAKATYAYGTTYYLTTPALTVSGTSDELTFDYRATANYVSVKIQMSKDGADFANFKTISGLNTMTEAATYTITGLAAGSYKFRFANDDYELDNFEGFKLNADAPEMTVSPTTAADFGNKVKAQPEAKIYTITNSGTGTLTGTIASSNTDHFTVSKTEFSLGAGEDTTFDITLVFDENYGDKAATITIHPTNDGLSDVTINATATTKDPNVWEEDFESGIPSTWINENNAWTTTRYGHTGEAGPGNDKTSTLTTPRLQATKDQVLQFDVIDAESETYFLKAEYSTDRTEWTLIENYTTEGTKEFTAPAAGYYWLRFTGNYTYVDNFSGFKEAPLEHDATISAKSIPATGNQYVEYTATVTVKEMAGKAEALTAKFFIGATQYGEAVTETVEANGTKTFTVTFTPEEAVSGDAYFTVSNANLNLQSDKQTVSIAAATIWKDTEDNEIATGTYTSLVIQYTMAKGWNTVCLPIATSISSFGEGVKAYSFTGYVDGSLKFSKVTGTTINAATPYLLYAPEAASINLPYLNQTIYGAYIGADNIKTTSNGATFQGTYEPMAAGTLEGKYGVIPSTGKIVLGDDAVTMKGFRGYFELPAGAPAPSIEVDGQATGISDIMREATTNKRVYNLQGVEVAQPTKGLYIVNGHVVVVK